MWEPNQRPPDSVRQILYRSSHGAYVVIVGSMRHSDEVRSSGSQPMKMLHCRLMLQPHSSRLCRHTAQPSSILCPEQGVLQPGSSLQQLHVARSASTQATTTGVQASGLNQSVCIVPALLLTH